MKKRFISIMMALLLVAGLPVSAFADYDLYYGDVTVTATADDSGNTTQSVSYSYADENGAVQTGYNPSDSNPVITSSQATSNTVTIDATLGSEAQVTIKDVNIENANGEAIDIDVDSTAKADVTLQNVSITSDENGKTTTGVSVASSSKDTNITLDNVTVDLSAQKANGTAMSVSGYNGETNVELGGNNELTSSGTSVGLSTGTYHTLTITDKDNDNGTLEVTGSSGIGSDGGSSEINIEGGTINATGTAGDYLGYTGAGIGGKYFTIKISGGKVSATGAENYAGIRGSNIQISGGEVTANGGTGNADGIDSGDRGYVTISGGAVIAKGNGKGAGIYTNQDFDETRVTISGTTAKAPTVKVQGGQYKEEDGKYYTAAGIGTRGDNTVGEQTGMTIYRNGVEILPKTCELFGGTIEYYKQGAEKMDSSSLLKTITGIAGTGEDGTGKDGGVHHEEHVDKVDATCTQEGHTEGYKCTESGCTYTRDIETIDTVPHTFGEWEEITAATCGTSGTQKHTCSVCESSAYETIPATGDHTVVIDEAVAATCTKTGLTEGSHCSECNTVIKAQEVTSATDHNWNDGDVIVVPTATKGGWKIVVCNDCGTKDWVQIPATGDETKPVEPTPTPTPSPSPSPAPSGKDTDEDTGKTDTDKGDTGKTDTKPDSGKTDGKDTGKTDGGKTNANTSGSGNASWTSSASASGAVAKKTADELSKYKLATLYRVTNEGNYDAEHTAVIKNGVLTITAEKDFANLKGRLSGISVLMSYGVEKIEFVTNGATSTFVLADLLAEGGASDGYVLTHDGANVTFTFGSGSADISSILQS